MTGVKFGVVHTEVIRDPDLSLRAKGMYALLCTFADKERMCFPSIKTLSELSGVTRRTTERTLKELEEKNYVKREGRKFRL
jgi:DNA-binding MarR family transcriptional regulator